MRQHRIRARVRQFARRVPLRPGNMPLAPPNAAPLRRHHPPKLTPSLLLRSSSPSQWDNSTAQCKDFNECIATAPLVDCNGRSYTQDGRSCSCCVEGRRGRGAKRSEEERGFPRSCAPPSRSATNAVISRWPGALTSQCVCLPRLHLVQNANTSQRRWPRTTYLISRTST